MLDFNDTQQPIQPRRIFDDSEREALRAGLIGALPSVLATLFPAGKKRRSKFLIGDVLGSPGDSLEVVLDGEKAGLWTDRATGDGGDIFNLIAGYLALKDRKSTRLNSSHLLISYAVFCLKKKTPVTS